MGFWGKLAHWFGREDGSTAEYSASNHRTPALKPEVSLHREAILQSTSAVDLGDFQQQEPLADISFQRAEHLFLASWLDITDASQLKPDISEALKNKLLNPQYREKAVPRLPAVLPKLMRALRDPDTAVRDCIDLVKQDAALLASVLQIANSSFYKPSGSAQSSIEQAVVSLGVEGLRRVVCAALVKPIANRSGAVGEKKGGDIWQYSLRTAVVAEELARARGCDVFVAYLLGLCQGLGYVTLYNEHLRYKNDNEESSLPINAKSYQAALAFANELSAEIVSDWPMPSELARFLFLFAKPTEAGDLSPAEHSYVSLLQQAVYVSQLHTLEKQGQLLDGQWDALCQHWCLSPKTLSQLTQSSL